MVGEGVLGQAGSIVNPHLKVRSRTVGSDEPNGHRVVVEHQGRVLLGQGLAWGAKRRQGPTRTANGHLKLVGAGESIHQMRGVEAVDVDVNGLGQVGSRAHKFGGPAG